MEPKKRNLILKLYEVNAIKFGTFILKSGLESPVYLDLRVIVSYPEIMKEVANIMWTKAEENTLRYDSVCGVPYTALPIATCISTDHNIPMLIRRKETKDYGTKKMIEGSYKEDDYCLIIEDVVTSGTSVYETAQALNSVGVKVRDAIVLLDREQGGADSLKTQDIHLHSVCTMTEVLTVLEKHNKIDKTMVEKTKEFIYSNRFDQTVKKPTPQANGDHTGKKIIRPTWAESAQKCKLQITARLYNIMHKKKTNLAVSVDVHSCREVKKIIEAVGLHVCIVKTHIDIIEDFVPEFTKELQDLAEKYNFLIFEDRKFADIGNTVQSQYSRGIYKISDWADIVNVHPLPGKGVISGLQQVVKDKGLKRGCLLVAEMSSAGNLITKDYTQASLRLAEADEHKDFVMGFVCQSRLTEDPSMIHMVPGVKLSSGGDNLGQQYTTPEEAVIKRGADIIIVGRGITEADNLKEEAERYQKAGYEAYLKTVS
ncbi:hypothetical protein FSP39_013212 [Pinctada imbricata]|uniref:Uridine 5'-monophosphate synthase n=1 Tax=Pinctada imbricata TaxID=66713 RepID=A0AA88YMV3_PINIB|nr:hypothetical protein FSP39_013212 [Pinctada imbricata]